MVKIYSLNGNILLSIFKTNKFSEILNMCKTIGNNRFSASEKAWVLQKDKVEQIIEKVKSLGESVEITDSAKQLLQKFKEENFEKEFPKQYLKVPPIVGKEPFLNFQLEDIQKAYNKKRFAIFNDTGTGKSYIILSVLNAFLNEGKINKVLYITSNSGVWDIYNKFPIFSDFKKEELIIGNKKVRRPFEQLDKKVVICNYRSLLLMANDYDNNITQFSNKVKEWVGDKSKAVIVCDESHNIANINAKQTKVVHAIKGYFDYRYALTGTPADKKEKYYSQLGFLDENLIHGKNYFQWLNYYAYIGNAFSKIAINSWKADKLKELQAIVSQNCTRRLAKDVLLLPDNVEKTINVDILPEHYDIYVNYAKEYLRNKFSGSNKILTKDFMACVPALILPLDNPTAVSYENLSSSLANMIRKFNFEKHHIKVEIVKDILEDISEEKVIIWTSHPSVAEKLQEIFKKENPLVLNGTVKVPAGMTLDEYKNKIITEFQEKKEHRILIAGVQVLNSAVTITKASVQIYFDTDFNYVTTKQSQARIYRIGQDKTVHTFKIIANGTLDVTRNKLMENKNYVNEKFLSKEYIDNDMAESILFGK